MGDLNFVTKEANCVSSQVETYKSTKGPAEPYGYDASGRQADKRRLPVVVSDTATFQGENAHDRDEEHGVNERDEDVLVGRTALLDPSHLWNRKKIEIAILST